MNRTARIVVLCMCAATAVAQSNMRPSDPELNREHTEWIASVLHSVEAIRVGMARSDLLKVFTTEGGLSTTSRRTYVLRQCPYIKVDVRFAAAKPDQELPTDKIIEISKPYLAWSVFD